ncbi:MAG: permease-like cell division protein FtsX [Bacteroidales bacterium]|nr:permease-like cell division protein FtsX [Bacteroidales bacterium]
MQFYYLSRRFTVDYTLYTSMSKQEDNFTKRRLRTSYFTSVISITLVLFILGFFGLIMLHSNMITKHVKENIQMNVYMKKNAKEAEIYRLKKELDATENVKHTRYISAEEAKNIYKEEIGEDFIAFLDGENPLHASIEIHLTEAYANVSELKKLSEKIAKRRIVEDVRFHENYVEAINKNIGRITLFFLIVSGMLLLVSIVLINNTIRLSVYSNRFIIRSMRLIGATQRFIRKPFIWRGIFQGVISAIISIAMLVGILIKLNSYYPELVSVNNIDLYLLLFASIFVIGIIISWWSSSLSVRKFLRMKIDNLYLS